VDILTDEQIQNLIDEPKVLPDNYRKRLLEMKPKPNGSHSEGELVASGDNGSEFLVKTRLSIHNPFNFSVILMYSFPDTSRMFRLRRYNGRTTPHLNPLENQRILGFHIHKATERYQEAGYDEDTYAMETDRYTDLHGALRCMIDDCGFIRPENDQVEMF
jgi:hypothetical protein